MLLSNTNPQSRVVGHDDAVPVKWPRLIKVFEEHGWRLDRISGSHFIFVKSGHRSIPLAFHGNRSLTKKYVKLVLKQADIVGDVVAEDEESYEDATPQVMDVTDPPNEGAAAVRLTKRVVPIPDSKCLTHTTSLDKDEWRKQHQTQRVEVSKEILRRESLLESVQCLVAEGNFAQALASIESEKLDLVDTSDKNYEEFSSNLFFFKIIAKMELALSYPLNSPQQREGIIATLNLSSRYMEAVRDRRHQARELAMGLQARVMKLYVQEATEASRKCMAVILRRDLPTNHALLDFFPNEGVSSSREFVFSQLDVMLECLHFIVSMYKLVLSQPFDSVKTVELAEEVEVATLVSPCITRMLLLFSMENFDAATQAADSLLFVAEHFQEGITMIWPFGPRKAWITKSLIISISEHVKALAPVYHFAKEELKWSRLAGVVARCNEAEDVEELETRFRRGAFCLSSALTFTQRALDVMATHRNGTEELIVSTSTRTFMFDSLLDPIELLGASVDEFMATDPVGMKLNEVKKWISTPGHEHIDVYIKKHQGPCNLREFRTGKYDHLRRQLLLILRYLHQISDVYATYCDHLDTESRKEMEGNKIYTKHRFERINSIRYDLVFLFSILFDNASQTTAWMFAYKALVIFSSDLDVSHRFHTETPSKLRGPCETKEEMYELGVWAFDHAFKTYSPLFLRRYVIETEARRLCVIRGIIGPFPSSFMPDHQGEALEAMAFSLLSQVLKR